VWNELLSFPLAQPGGEQALPRTPLRVSLRHRSMTVFQRDSVIAEADVPMPDPDALVAPGAPLLHGMANAQCRLLSSSDGKC